MKSINKQSFKTLLNPLRSFTTSNNKDRKSNFSWECGKYDPSQISQMQDMMTRVDENDRILGPISKLDGHLMINGENLPS